MAHSASSAGGAGRSRPRPSRARSASPCRTPEGAPGGRVQRAGGDPSSGHPHDPGGGQGPADADDVVGTGAAQGPAHGAQAQPRVGDHDHRAGPPAGVDRGREVGARRHEQRDPVARAHPGRGQPGGEVPHPLVQQGERHAPVALRPARPRPRRGSPARAVSADHRGAPPAGVGLVPPGGGPLEVTHPAPHVVGGARRVLGDQVRGPLVAVHLGVRQAGEQVTQVEVGEDRVARAPEQQDRHVGEDAQALGDPVQRGGARVRRAPAGCRPRSRRPPAAGCAVAYGAASASRTAAGRAGRDSAEVVRTNAGVPTQTVCRRPGVRASRISEGAAAPAGWCTAVLVRTTPRSWSRCASAQPSDTGPPQSWATVTTGPVMPRASVRAPRSSTRWARVRGAVRSDQPMPSWSTATTRQPAGACARKRRHR